MIGFYDSGIGGVTVLNEYIKNRQNYNILYLADTLHNPLGDKTQTQIAKIIKDRLKILFENDCKSVFFACNTASTVFLNELQDSWLKKEYPEKKIFEIITPTINYIDQNIEKTSKILIIATPATIKSNIYFNKLSAIGFKNITQKSIPNLAKHIEQREYQKSQNLINNILKDIPNLKNIDYVLLGCTHYPIIKKQFLYALDNYKSKARILTQEQIISNLNFPVISNNNRNGQFIHFIASKDQVKFQENLKSLFSIDQQVGSF